MKSKCKIIGLATVIMILALLSGCHQASNDVEVNVSIGYDNIARISEDNPFRAVIKNNGKAFKGELQVEVNQNAYSKIMIAMPIEVEENGEKEVNMAIPIYTVQKKFDVRIVTNNQKVVEEVARVSQIISPVKATIAVISDQPDDYRFINQVKSTSFRANNQIINNSYEYETKEEADRDEEPPYVIYFDDFNQINKDKSLDFFDYIFIGSNQNLTMSKDLEQEVINWLNDGNVLITQTGADYKRLQSLLPERLINYHVSATKKQYVENVFDVYELNDTLILTEGETKGEIVSDNRAEYAAVTNFNDGRLITLTYDYGEDPIDEWYFKADLLNTIIDRVHYGPIVNAESSKYNVRHGMNSFRWLLENLPTNKKFPYLLMAFIIVIYIILVGPVLYFVLKKRDQRDWMWVGIPVLSMLCILSLYLFGFSTRYSKPIEHTISIIQYDNQNDFMTIESEMALFNNEKGNIEFSWDLEDHIKLSSYSDYGYRGGNGEQILSAKITRGAQEKYEVFDTPLWSPTYLKGSKVLPANFAEGDFIKIDMAEDETKFTITNITELKLEKAFLVWANKPVYVGDIEPGEQKIVTINGDNYTYANLITFIDKHVIMGNQEEERYERDIYRNVIERDNEYGLSTAVGAEKARFYALNDMEIGYNIKANDQKPKSYSKNVFIMDTTLKYRSGDTIIYDNNSIMPAILFGPNEENLIMRTVESYGDDDYSIYFFEKGIAKCVFKIPENIEVKTLEATLHYLFPEDKYNDDRGRPNEEFAVEGVVYSIYNAATDSYEEVTDLTNVFKLNSNDYIDEYNQVTIVIDDRGINSTKYRYDNRVQLPSIYVEGVVTND